MDYDEELFEEDSSQSSLVDKVDLSSVQIIPSSIKIHQFSEKFEETRIFFQITVLKESFMIWIGINPPSVGELSVSMKTPHDSYPSVSSLIGNTTEGYGQNLSRRLVSKFGKAFFVANGLPNDQMLLSFAEKKLIEKITKVISF